MTSHAGTNEIVVGVDGSLASEAAVRWAAAESVLHGAAITLVHVIPAVLASSMIQEQPNYFQLLQWQEGYARELLEQSQKTVMAAVGESEVPVVRTQIHHAWVVDRLLHASAQATMTVVGSRGLGRLGGFVLGSVSRTLLHRAHGPVAVIHPRHGPATHTAAPVLLRVDGSPASEAATAMAFDEASRRGVHLVALHAWSDAIDAMVPGIDWRQYEQQGHLVLAERLAGWQDKYPDVSVDRRIVGNDPARWLIEESERAQLVVLGSHSRGGLAGMLLGSVSTAVVEASRTPVMVIRPEP